MQNQSTPIKQILQGLYRDDIVKVQGLVRTFRQSKNVAFIAINDGSTFESLQVVLGDGLGDNLYEQLGTGAALEIEGTVVASPAAGQSWELQATDLRITGPAGSEYPLQKKRHSLEYLRSIGHLRPRTNTFNAVFRLRSFVSHAIHRYFEQRGFYWMHTPIITANDCEGAGEQFRVTTLPRITSDDDFGQDFFGQPASLTVSGQLEGEALATALGKIYTFGPTFRSENSNTSRHLAEFWMIEPEVAFADLDDMLDLAEDFIISIVQQVLEHCQSELNFFEQFVESGLLQKLQAVSREPFARITYSDAVAILQKCGEDFEYPVQWGADLQAEHERYLCENHMGKPVFVTDYPADIKAFYMKLSDDERTVRAMDLLLPGIGEIIGGSQREDRHDVLKKRMEQFGIDCHAMSWYLELRRFGNQPHAGFGLGLERLLQYLSGMGNIRDVIPFPRAPRQI
ncbi:asparagine--tRNA ligase [Desulfurispira natronophila]|uniref:Asparagine--tRNA ligase n=1 Tax=Desulfurispira natronophila TaxID=682562 RepID=A0A7W7Y5X6_9BACT|nr:asparagine--tRNA ligase [Desulfurispira natronophila]MBB5022597.1 asparaginyl-tRNA synthetase [Desulfurispira natronophila]